MREGYDEVERAAKNILPTLVTMKDVKELEIDFEALRQKMLDRKKELKEDITKDAEHSMIAQAEGKRDSPAAASRTKAPSILGRTAAGQFPQPAR